MINQMIAQRPELSQMSPMAAGAPSMPPQAPVQPQSSPMPTPPPAPSMGLPPHPVMNQQPQPQQMQKPALPMTQENVIVQAIIKQLERLDTNKKMPGIQLPPGMGSQ
jgi:hypothetical protein